MRTSIAFLTAAALVATVSSPAWAQEETDELVWKTGKSQKVRVKSETLDGIVFQIGPAESTATWDKVTSVKLAGAEAANLARGVDNFNQGKFAEAVSLLQPLTGEKVRAPIRQRALFYVASAKMRMGDEKAAEAYEEVLAAYPKGRYARQVGQNLLAVQLARNNVPGAQKALDAYKAAVGSPTADVAILEGRLFEVQKRTGDALAAYTKAANSAGSDVALKAEANLGVARSQHTAGKLPEAEKGYRELISAEAPNRVLAGAWNGIADLAYAEGFAKRDPDKLLEALYAYLRGIVQYAPTGDEPRDEHERSLAGSARSFKALAELDSSADRKKMLNERARQKLEQLKTQYPGSRYLEGN